MPGRAGDKQKKKPISLLLANKTDVGPRVATETAIERFARDVGFSAWSLGSAKEGSGVKAALDRHVEAIVTANGLDRRPATGMARQHTEGLGAGEEIKYNVPSPLLPLSDVATEPNSTEGQDDDFTASGKHDEGWLDRFWSDFEVLIAFGPLLPLALEMSHGRVVSGHTKRIQGFTKSYEKRWRPSGRSWSFFLTQEVLWRWRCPLNGIAKNGKLCWHNWKLLRALRL